MMTAKRIASRLAGVLAIALLCGSAANAVGTGAGIDISNTATATFSVGGTPFTEDSDTEVIRVAEVLDVEVTLLTVTSNPNNEVTVAPGDTDQVLTFSVTNTGNGSDEYSLSAISGPGLNLSGTDTFDPTVVDIYFDDGTTPGVFDAGDTRYDPGTDDPTILADGFITIHVLNNIDAGAVDGDLGDSQLVVTSNGLALFPGGSVAGDSVAAAGDNSGDLVLGNTEATGDAFGTYLVSTLEFNFNKTSAVLNGFGNSEPIPGSIVTYTLTAEVTGSGTATGVVITDDVPANTTYVAESMTLNGGGQTDALDSGTTDEADFDPVGGPLNNGSITLDLGDLTPADGVQTITFQVTID
ncbi:MAG: hypothetical protein AB8G23_18960 [Myxococcota bacterium]